MSPLVLEVGWPPADNQVVVAVAVDVHALDRSGVLGVDGAGGPPRHALDVGELAVARVEEDLVRVGVRAGASSWGYRRRDKAGFELRFEKG